MVPGGPQGPLPMLQGPPNPRPYHRLGSIFLICCLKAKLLSLMRLCRSKSSRSSLDIASRSGLSWDLRVQSSFLSTQACCLREAISWKCCFLSSSSLCNCSGLSSLVPTCLQHGPPLGLHPAPPPQPLPHPGLARTEATKNPAVKDPPILPTNCASWGHLLRRFAFV